jgi:hypothetical protein
MEKKFEVHCDYCFEVTDNFDTFNEWQEYEPDTLSLNVCKKCQFEEYVKQSKINKKSLDKR